MAGTTWKPRGLIGQPWMTAMHATRRGMETHLSTRRRGHRRER